MRRIIFLAIFYCSICAAEDQSPLTIINDSDRTAFDRLKAIDELFKSQAVQRRSLKEFREVVKINDLLEVAVPLAHTPITGSIPVSLKNGFGSFVLLEAKNKGGSGERLYICLSKDIVSLDGGTKTTALETLLAYMKDPANTKLDGVLIEEFALKEK